MKIYGIHRESTKKLFIPRHELGSNNYFSFAAEKKPRLKFTERFKEQHEIFLA